jgi:hypothetical protein
MKSRKGQMLMITLLMLIMAIMIFIATLPATKEVINKARGCDYLNCKGYIDPEASGGNSCTSNNQTYSSSLETDSLSCTSLDLFIPFLVLCVLGAIGYKIMRGDSIEQPMNPYGY